LVLNYNKIALLICPI